MIAAVLPLSKGVHAQGADGFSKAPSAVNMETDVLFFASGSDRLTPESDKLLTDLAGVMKTEVMAGACLLLVGHSDTVGPEAANLRISEKRAERVRALLQERMAPQEIQIAIEAMGESDPIEGEPGESAKNRRVVIWARRCPGAA
ncbi:OmpA family protein [Pseudoruegeria sp. SHC-113]|uniref:OmpA family protein n=1 Tax=Pseudoruegeria sp. SHC-113 TaxID=2855439 RepID=UPI0021BAFCDE|nr:OmpA family protein [Pseudoruegeria sp. SHC-113]MCT8159568.1 OmpA family protein [Pseudoruegeria sp. SHC-113]